MQVKDGSYSKYCIELETRKNIDAAASMPESLGQKAEQRSLSQDEQWISRKEPRLSP